MDERGWKPTGKRQITSGLDGTINARDWLFWWLFRFYVPVKSPHTDFRDLIAFVIRFDGPQPFDQAVVLWTAARFSAPTSYEIVWEQWKDDTPVIEALDEKPGPRPLSSQEVSTFLPGASHVVGSVV